MHTLTGPLQNRASKNMVRYRTGQGNFRARHRSATEPPIQLYHAEHGASGYRSKCTVTASSPRSSAKHPNAEAGQSGGDRSKWR
jgi:hypothetical protein